MNKVSFPGKADLSFRVWGSSVTIKRQKIKTEVKRKPRHKMLYQNQDTIDGDWNTEGPSMRRVGSEKEDTQRVQLREHGSEGSIKTEVVTEVNPE